jgi:hypothetical protein
MIPSDVPVPEPRLPHEVGTGESINKNRSRHSAVRGSNPLAQNGFIKLDESRY